MTEEQRLLLENDFADKNVVDLNERLREQDRKREKKRRHDKISVRGQEALLMQMQSEIEFSWMSCLKNQEWILYPRLLLHIDMITYIDIAFLVSPIRAYVKPSKSNTSLRIKSQSLDSL